MGMSRIFGVGKRKKNPPRAQRPPRTPAPPIVEIRRRFLKMKRRGMIYAVVGAASVVALSFLPLLVHQIKDSIAIGLSLATALILGYLSMAEVTNAFSYYLFARIREELKGRQPPLQEAVAPTPQPLQMQAPTRPFQPVTAQKPAILSAPQVKIEHRPEPQPLPIPSKPTVQSTQPPPSPPVGVEPAVKPKPPVKTPPVKVQQPSTSSDSGKKRCPYCGRELPYGDLHVICPFCGRRLK